jgi:uncharacterized membrane protein
VDSVVVGGTPAEVGPEEAGDFPVPKRMKVKHFLDQLEHDRVAAAIREAEKKSSGQIVVFVTHRRPKDALAFARKSFRKLKLHRTAKRNGVLILVAPAAQKVAIFGDTAVDTKSDEAFWEEVIQQMQPYLKKGEFTAAIVQAVEKVGSVLATHFPPDGSSRQNEISDEVVED